MARKLTLGTRGSPLAMAQARAVAAALEAAHDWADGTITLKPITTTGDVIKDRPLSEVGGKLLWTKELDHQLAAGETDLSVHSMKDVESDRPGAFVIAAMLERADPRDRLIGAQSLADLPEGARVGTSSPRRAAQLLSIRPDAEIVTLRGNVQTRLAKIESGEADATFLAAAGLERLGIATGAAIPVETMLPAPGQAAIGIECRGDDDELVELLSAIDHVATHRAVAMERAFTRRLGGTCHSPVGAHGVVEDKGVRLIVQLLSDDGSETISDDRLIEDEAQAIALADAMLEKAPDSIRRLFEGT